jgi:hypothetical protein
MWPTQIESSEQEKKNITYNTEIGCGEVLVFCYMDIKADLIHKNT